MRHLLFGALWVFLSLLPVCAHAATNIAASSLSLAAYKPWMSRPGIDKSIDGRTISIGGAPYERGFGMRARQQVLLQLNSGSRRFSASVGVDDEPAAREGVVEFRVLGDARKLLWSSGPMKHGQNARPVELDVTGVRLLTLLAVEAGGRYWGAGHADWADPRLEVTGEMPLILDPDAPVHAFELGPQVEIATNPAPDVPRIHPPFKVGVRPNTELVFSIPATGRAPLRFTAKGLPKGLNLDPATGILRGIVSDTGDHTLQIRVENAAGVDERALHVVVGDTLALTPPLGWNSFDNFGGSVNEQQVLSHARYMAEFMKPLGWRYVVIDYIWYDPSGGGNKNLAMDEFGRFLPATNRFPSATNGRGFKSLADEVHSLGLSFGFHIMRGIPRLAVAANTPIAGSAFRAADAADTNSLCEWNTDMYGVRGTTPAGQAYYDSILKLYAQWGVDFIKVDDISSPYHADEIQAVHEAILKSGRSVVLSLSPGPAPLDRAQHLIRNANQWRETGDFWDNWDQLETQFDKGAAWSPYVGPGHWPDADMLPVGHIGELCVGLPRESNFNKAEQTTLLTLWSIQSSPLMAGGDLTRNDPWTLALLTNPEVLAVNQDSLGTGAERLVHLGSQEVWRKPLADGSVAVALFNRGEQDARINVTRADLRITGSCTVRNLWLRRDAGSLADEFGLQVPAHGAAFVRIQPQKTDSDK